MKALVTGASSGIGRDIAEKLSDLGYDIILVGRNNERLQKTADSLKTKSYIISSDLSDRNACLELYQNVQGIAKEDDLEIVINNAGFGLFGEFNNTNINTELNMIDTNIAALHILTKLFLNYFIKKDRGYILNVASSAAFMPGPLMATYYSTKAYVLRLTQAIAMELRQSSSNVYIGALCPGPVNTSFNNTAGVKFAIKGLKSADVASYAVKKMFKKKTVIIPGTTMKLGKVGLRFLPDRLAAKVAYNIQRSKG